MLPFKSNHMCKPLSEALRGNMQKRIRIKPFFLYVCIQINDSTSFILYLAAPAEAINLFLVLNYLSSRILNNSKRRNDEVMDFSKRCFPTYLVIGKSPLIAFIL